MGLLDSFIFKFLMNLHTVFHCIFKTSHFHQQGIYLVPVSPHAYKYSLSFYSLSMWRNWNQVYTLLMEMWNFEYAMENSMEVNQKLKNITVQQSHFPLYIQRNWKQDHKEVYALPCSLQHLFTKSKTWN